MSTAANDDVLVVHGVSKRYEIYERPADRLKQFFLPRLDSVLSRKPRSFFKEFWALRDVSLSVRKGEAVGILGRNGAGKSTLLQIIAGTLAPTQGETSVRGRVAALLELGSGFSPEFTGSENVRLNAALLGLSPQQIDAAFDQIAAFADIGDFINQPVKIYSSGMMLRLAFAVQTAVEPDLLIVDEALAVGDARFQKKCFDRLEAMRAHGTTILFVTHDTGAVVRLCSRAIILENGQILSDGPPQMVARQYHRLLFEGIAEPVEPREQARTASQLVTREQTTYASGNPVDGAAVAGAEPDEDDAKLEIRAGPMSEVRYGSRDVEIFDIGLRDARGEPARAVEVHQPCELFFRVRFNATVTDPVGYGFIISNVRGIEVFATKAGLYKKAIPPSNEGTAYECCLRVVMLIVPGTYFLSAAVAYDGGGRSGEFLDCRFDALQFEVIGIPRSFMTCVVDLNGDLGHSMIDQERSDERSDARWA